MIRAKDVKPLKNYLILVRFVNDEERVFNCHPLITDDKLFSKLMDPNYFNKVHIDEMGIVCWDEATDINPYYLYEESQAVSGFSFAS